MQNGQLLAVRLQAPFACETNKCLVYAVIAVILREHPVTAHKLPSARTTRMMIRLRCNV